MLINEFLPNPAGKDPAGEFIELFNESRDSQNLSGWKLKDASGKTFALKNITLGANEYLVLENKATKISLNNNEEAIYLFNATGKQIDSLGFTVSAPSGKSFIRQLSSQGVFTDKPTPGAPNIFENQSALQNTAGDTNARLALAANASSKNATMIINTSSDATGIFLGIAIALTLTTFFLFVYKNLGFDEEL